MTNAKQRATLRIFLALAGAAGLFWFMAPLTVRVLNIGNITGIILSLALLGIALFFAPLGRWLCRVRSNRFGRGITSVMAVILGVAVLSGAVLSGFMLTAAMQQPPDHTTVVVLGCKLNGVQPSLMLERRLEAAKQYLQEHPDAPCIVSGGQGANEDVSEAQAMKTWLVANGIEESRIYQEDESTNTEENIRNSKRIIEQNGFSTDIAVVTDGFHELRASLIAKKQYLTPYSVPAQTPWFVFSAYYVRELYGLAQQLLLK